VEGFSARLGTLGNVVFNHSTISFSDIVGSSVPDHEETEAGDACEDLARSREQPVFWAPCFCSQNFTKLAVRASDL